MKKQFLPSLLLKLSFLFIILGLFSCSSSKKLSTEDSIIEATIVHLNDVYEIDALDGGKSGGMARVAHIIRAERKKNKNTLAVLAGDFLNPSLLGTLKYNGERIRGRQMVEVMNAIGIDLVVFGNHEFDLKMPDLQKRLNESDSEWLGTNVRQITDQSMQKFYQEKNGVRKEVLDHFLWNLNGAKDNNATIGFFGAIINSNPVDFVKYNDWTESTIHEIQLLKEKQVDYIIGLTHLDETQDFALANKVSEIDLILGGHDHHNMALEANGTKIYKADANAKTIYIHRIKINTKTGTSSVTSELIKIDPNIPSEVDIKNLINKWNLILEKQIKQIIKDPYEVVYTTATPLDGREKNNRHRITNFGQLITDAFMMSSRKEAECAIVNSGSIRLDDQLRNDIYAIDIFRALPYGGHMAEVNMKGALLIKILNTGEASKGNGAFLQRSSNIEYFADNSSWYVDDNEVIPNKNYTVVMTDFLLLGFDIDYLTKDHPDINWIDVPDKSDDLDDRRDIRKVIINYMKSSER